MANSVMDLHFPMLSKLIVDMVPFEHQTFELMLLNQASSAPTRQKQGLQGTNASAAVDV